MVIVPDMMQETTLTTTKKFYVGNLMIPFKIYEIANDNETMEIGA